MYVLEVHPILFLYGSLRAEGVQEDAGIPCHLHVLEAHIITRRTQIVVPES